MDIPFKGRESLSGNFIALVKLVSEFDYTLQEHFGDLLRIKVLMKLMNRSGKSLHFIRFPVLLWRERRRIDDGSWRSRPYSEEACIYISSEASEISYWGSRIVTEYFTHGFLYSIRIKKSVTSHHRHFNRIVWESVFKLMIVKRYLRNRAYMWLTKDLRTYAKSASRKMSHNNVTLKNW